MGNPANTAGVPDGPAVDERRPIATDALRVLAEHRRHRAIVRCLRTEDSLARGALARHVVARCRDCPVGEVTDADRRRVTADLHHDHLPRLTSVGLIERGGDGVTLAVDPDRVTALECVDADEASAEAWEAVAVLLADDRRELVVSMLETVAKPVSLADLAVGLASREYRRQSAPAEAVDAARRSLHHVHLPLLDEVGVVAYDARRKRVTLERLPTPYVATRRSLVGVPTP